ncbi:hypothetical protein, partial [Nocardia farcinica]
MAHGTGYDDVHRRLLRELQERQREQRNRPGGYWIAEADPSAAAHAIWLDIPPNSVSWLVAATDGAREPIQSLGIPWTDIAQQSADELGALLRTCHSWEAETDPDGRSNDQNLWIPGGRAFPEDDRRSHRILIKTSVG